MMNDDGQSDSCIVPTKSANKVLPAKTAEQMEGRRLVKGNANESPMSRTQGRKEGMKETLRRIRQAVEREPKEKLTSLYHTSIESRTCERHTSVLRRMQRQGSMERHGSTTEKSLRETLITSLEG